MLCVLLLGVQIRPRGCSSGTHLSVLSLLAMPVRGETV